MPQLRLHNLTLGYDRHPAVHHLDGVVKDGALLAVVGPNGAGKSTLFKALAGAIRRDGILAYPQAYPIRKLALFSPWGLCRRPAPRLHCRPGE
jgi:ABC-type Mn2+/Zn2+ transport system ATPase subunit